MKITCSLWQPFVSFVYIFILIFACLLYKTHSADAHSIDVAIPKIDKDHALLNIQLGKSELYVSLQFQKQILVHVTDVNANDLGFDDIPKNAVKIFETTLGQNFFRFDGQDCKWDNPTVTPMTLDSDIIEVAGTAVCTPLNIKDITIEYSLSFLEKTDPSFEVVAQIEDETVPTTFVVTPANFKLHYNNNDARSVMHFLTMGMAHIGAWPSEWKLSKDGFEFPEGIDHILFVLAVIIGGGTMWSVLKNVTGFTIGHSLTLILATFNMISVNSKWVEALIALSIAYLAIAALWRPESRHRWIVATLFGTIHGLGFATAIKELALPKFQFFTALFGFNLGVELGQCIIILLIFPILWQLQIRSPTTYKYSHRSIAICLALIGSYWFFTRIQ